MTENKKGIYQRGDWNGIPIYQDDYINENEVLILYKSKSTQPSGIVYVPYANFKDVKATPIEKDEVDRILKMKKNRNIKDVKAIICNSKNIEQLNKDLNNKFPENEQNNS